MRTNWKKLANKISPQIKVGPRKYYEVLWVDEFPKDHELMGEMRPDSKQVVIRKGLGPKETVGTFFHEFLHAVSDENEVGLTERQVATLEKRFVEFKLFFGDLT